MSSSICIRVETYRRISDLASKRCNTMVGLVSQFIDEYKESHKDDVEGALSQTILKYFPASVFRNSRNRLGDYVKKVGIWRETSGFLRFYSFQLRVAQGLILESILREYLDAVAPVDPVQLVADAVFKPEKPQISLEFRPKREEEYDVDAELYKFIKWRASIKSNGDVLDYIDYVQKKEAGKNGEQA